MPDIKRVGKVERYRLSLMDSITQRIKNHFKCKANSKRLKDSVRIVMITPGGAKVIFSAPSVNALRDVWGIVQQIERGG